MMIGTGVPPCRCTVHGDEECTRQALQRDVASDIDTVKEPDRQATGCKELVDDEK